MFQVTIGDKFTLGEGHTAVAGSKFSTLGGIVSTIIPNVMVVASIILFFLILLGGFTLITSAGNPDKQQQGSAILTYSLIGFLIIFGAYWIMQLLGIITGYALF